VPQLKVRLLGIFDLLHLWKIKFTALKGGARSLEAKGGFWRTLFFFVWGASKAETPPAVWGLKKIGLLVIFVLEDILLLVCASQFYGSIIVGCESHIVQFYFFVLR